VRRTSDFKNNAQVWLQIELESGPGVGANEAPLPRQMLTASSYAFVAHHATTAATATSAATLACSPACVSIAELEFDPATQAELNAAVANVVTTSSLTATLGNYVTSASLTTTLGNYVTSTSLATSLGAYVTSTGLSSQLGNYVTSSSLSTTLGNYVTSSSLGTTLGGYVTSSALTSALGGYVTSSALTSALGGYVSTASFNTTLGNYVTSTALASELTSYVTSSSLGTTLGSYVTGSALDTRLGNYVTTAALGTALGDYVPTTALSGYVTTTGLNNALGNYVLSTALTSTLGNYATTASLSAYVTSSNLNTILNAYATTTSLANYVLSTALTTTLASYVTGSALDTRLAAYVTTTNLSTTLGSYVTSTALTTALAPYALESELPTSVNGLAGGTISSAVTVNGALAATSIKQGGHDVCDKSGNCGTTLGAFDPVTACDPDQILRWTGTGWECVDEGGGALPSQPCTGANKAVQWDGDSWECVTISATGLSNGQANGFEAKDDWGDAWDGVSRAPKTWQQAKAACEADGGRLPTVTELWRNRSNYGTGNLGNNDDDEYLWTIAPSYQQLYYSAAKLSDASFTEYHQTSQLYYRCIWKSQTPTGFSGNRCFGPPGSECKTKDAFYNVDRWSRAPQYFPAAQRECELENAMVMTADDLESLIQAGYEFINYPDHGWPYLHWTTDSNYHQNGYGYISVIQWHNNPEPWWGPSWSNGWGNEAHHAGPSSAYMFRCIGKKTPNIGVPPSNPSCFGGCFTAAGTKRNRLFADSADRGTKTWLEAFNDCRDEGGTLPSGAEINALMHSGWTGGSNQWLWVGSPAVWGWQLYRWPNTANERWNSHYEYSESGNYQTMHASGPSGGYAYRCVWQEHEAQSWLSCPANQVQMRNETTGAYSCVASVPGNPNGKQNPPIIPPFVDAWGNAWDYQQRGAQTWDTARTVCEAFGGRLPLATELYRLRYQQGVVDAELGTDGSATQDYLWTLNPSWHEDYRNIVRLSDGDAEHSHITGGEAYPYRCVWPATRPEAFSGNACYGHPSDPCFETGRLRTDRYDRIPLPQPAAQWECRYLGGQLVEGREYAELSNANMPNRAPSVGMWSREWAYYPNTYPFLYYRGSAPVGQWQAETGQSEISHAVEHDYYPFRCVFSDVME